MTRHRVALACATVVVGALVWLRCGSLPADLLDLSGAQSIEIVDRSGELLYEARSDRDSRTAHIGADALPPTLVAARNIGLGAYRARAEQPEPPGLGRRVTARGAVAGCAAVAEGARTRLHNCPA